MDCSLPGSSVHGIFQARVLEWVAIGFPAINRSIKGHRCKSLWVKSPSRKGRVDTRAGADIKGSERSGGKAALGSRARKRSLLSARAAPRAPCVPAALAEGDPRVLPVDPPPELAALYLEAGPAGFAAPVCQLLRDRAPPPGRWGAAKGAWRAP